MPDHQLLKTDRILMSGHRDMLTNLDMTMMYTMAEDAQGRLSCRRPRAVP